MPRCSFLKLGGISNHTIRTEYRLLLQHFGSGKDLNAKLPLFLLRDVRRARPRVGDSSPRSAKRDFDAGGRIRKTEDSCRIGEDLDPETAHMRAGDKAADLGSRREGTVLILESRPTAAVSWRRLRASQSAFGKRSRPNEKDPLPQPARRRQGATPAE